MNSRSIKHFMVMVVAFKSHSLPLSAFCTASLDLHRYNLSVFRFTNVLVVAFVMYLA
jgi:hypothetical protein